MGAACQKSLNKRIGTVFVMLSIAIKCWSNELNDQVSPLSSAASVFSCCLISSL